MTMRAPVLALPCVAAAVAACSGAPGNTLIAGDGGGSDGGNGADVGSFGDSSSSDDGGGTALIYANTDTELYSMDPSSHVLTDIGPFDDGSGSAPVITDLAVDGNDDVWVNSETAIYRATLPSSGTGPVKIALQTQLGTSTKFYALGFTPAGVLQTGESLIAGDSVGDLYFIDATQSSSTPQRLGNFGSASGGGTWGLSGDVVFYTLAGTARGLATIRTSSGSKNDTLAEINMDLLKQAYVSKTPATTLLKQLVGASGTGYGRLFGVGAWGNSVYAFSRVGTGGSPPAQLVQIGAAGTGTVLQSFANIASGWSGAGVTTKASVTVVQ
ncbi:MAG TPA: hypothetical protein VIF09_17320 [Polyangiaceae bacterium]|jgi:hypothetical protein